LLVLSNLAELIGDAVRHGIEDLDNVFWLLLKDGVFSKVSEFKVNALGPVADLVVDDIYALESIA